MLIWYSVAIVFGMWLFLAILGLFLGPPPDDEQTKTFLTRFDEIENSPYPVGQSPKQRKQESIKE